MLTFLDVSQIVFDRLELDLLSIDAGVRVGRFPSQTIQRVSEFILQGVEY